MALSEKETKRVLHIHTCVCGCVVHILKPLMPDHPLNTYSKPCQVHKADWLNAGKAVVYRAMEVFLEME